MADEFSQKQIDQIRSVVVSGVGEALEQIVLPRLANLESDVDTLKTDVGSLKTDVGSLKKVQAEQGEQLERIERKLDATVAVTDRQDVRLKRIETHLKLPPVEFEPVT